MRIVGTDPKILEFYRLVREKLDEAVREYDLIFEDFDPSMVEISTNIRGRVGGRAGYTTEYGRRYYYLNFSREGIEKHWDTMVNDVIPHEVAHIVAFVRGDLRAKGHNAAWVRICRHLGGTGERCHSMGLTKARKVKYHIYDIDGIEVKLSSIRHNKLMKGKAHYSLTTNTGCRKKIHPKHYTGRMVA